MAYKYYDSFDISEDDYKKLYCKECTRNGSKTDILNFCVGCESLFCLECLKDHEKSESNLGWNGSGDYFHTQQGKIMENSAGDNNNSIRFNRNSYNRIRSMKLRRVIKIKDDIHSMQEKLLHSTHMDQTASEKRLKKVTEQIEAMFSELKTNVVQLLDEFKELTAKEIKAYHEEIEKSSTQKRSTVFNTLKLKSDAAYRNIQKAKTDREIERIQEFVEELKTDVSNISNNPEDDLDGKALDAQIQNANALFHQGLEDFIYSINTLGYHWTDKLDARKTFTEVSVQAVGDKAICDINGSCTMPDGCIVLTDWNNSNIKLLDDKFKVTQTCDLPGIPWAVASTQQDEVAVTLHYLQRVQFVSVSKSTMKMTQFFKVKEKCKGIAYNDNTIYVSFGGGGPLESQGQILVFDRNGTCLRAYINDDTGKAMFSCPQHIAVTKDSQKLYVADKNKGLVEISTRLAVSKTILSGKFKEVCISAKGVCICDQDNVFLSDCANNEVKKFSSAGDFLSKLDTQLVPPVKNPQSLCLTKDQCQLVVTSGNMNTVVIYDVKLLQNQHTL